MVTWACRVPGLLIALGLAAAPVGGQPPAGTGGVVRPAPAPVPSTTVRELAHNLAKASVSHLGIAKDLVLSAVDEIEGGPARRPAVERVWAAQFAPQALADEIAIEIATRFTAADQQAAADWDASLPALRLEIVRTLAAPPPQASIDPLSLTGQDAERWKLAERMVDVCDLFERGTGLLLTLNLRASLAALRLTGVPEPFIESRRRELEQGLRAQLDANRPAMRERALRATFVANRRAAPADLAAELDFFATVAGQARCRAQTEAVETVLVRRIDDLPRAVAAAPAAPAN